MRNYCTITGAQSDSFHVLTSIFEQSATSAAQRAEKRGLKRKPGVKPGAAAGDSTRASLEKEASRAKHETHAADVREHAKGALSKALLDETQVPPSYALDNAKLILLIAYCVMSCSSNLA